MFLLEAQPVTFGQFILNLFTAIASTGVIGFLFWTWLNSRISSIDEKIRENRARIIECEKKQMELLSKDDHFEIRKEDKEGLERQMSEMKKDIKDMPEKIVNLLKPFLK